MGVDFYECRYRKEGAPKSQMYKLIVVASSEEEADDKIEESLKELSIGNIRAVKVSTAQRVKGLVVKREENESYMSIRVVE